MCIRDRGSSEPEVIINPKENFNVKFDYYMAAYDDDLILIAAKGKKDIRITGAAAGASFEDIQSQLIDEKASSGWKEQIADAVDRVVDKMLKETPPETEEERQNCETMRETIKGMFLTQRRSKTEAAFITENIEDVYKRQGLVTMRQKNKTSLDFEEWMKTSSGFDMFVTPIRRSIVAEKASMRMAVLPQFSKNCIVSQDYRNVVHELLKELEG